MADKLIKVVTVVGARPQFIKAAALSRAIIADGNIEEVIVHSGQHYDHNLSGSFFDELSIPSPAYNLGIGSASHNEQIARFITAFDPILSTENPDMVIVYGDTNTTAAAAIATAKRNIPLAHVEAGLREWNKAIPEEINKMLTDAVTDLYFSPTQTGVDNLASIGITRNVFRTGDISLDLLYGSDTSYIEKAELLEKWNLPDEYLFMTCHRDRNTDIASNLSAILKATANIDKQILWPIHPRTVNAISHHDLGKLVGENLTLIDPLLFWETQSLLKNAFATITDSGGIIKEAYFHKVPCVIIDQQTEWLESVNEGWAVVTGPNEEQIINKLENVTIPSLHTSALGDGLCGERIVRHIKSFLLNIS